MILKSSNKLLENAFAWAQKKTKQFVVTGKKNGEINKGDGEKWYGPEGVVISEPSESWAKADDYIPSFWAGYFDRTAFYIRDFVHQACGAYYVGLEKEIFSMYRTFVGSASEETGWFALWAFNFNGTPYYMDTPNLKRFVRELTAEFELVEKAWELYLLTGDRRYAEDDVIFNFIEKTMTVLIDNLDGAVLKEKNGIPEGFGDIFEITATYNERGFHAAEAADSIAAMYKAILAYAQILEVRGNSEESKLQFQRAKRLKAYFNEEWSVVKGNDMFAYAIDCDGRKHFKWKKKGTAIHGGESLFFIPLKNLSYPGERNDKLLSYIHRKQKNFFTGEKNIESLTYLPEVFFRNGKREEAWYWMKRIVSKKDLPHEHKSQGTNGDYPEISFTLVSQTIEGLMGISVNALGREITTAPLLPKEIDDVSLFDFSFGACKLDIHLDKSGAEIKNNGDSTITWHYKSTDSGKTETVIIAPSETKSIKIVS